MHPELPCQRNCLACPMPQTFGMLTQGQATFGFAMNLLCGYGQATSKP